MTSIVRCLTFDFSEVFNRDCENTCFENRKKAIISIPSKTKNRYPDFTTMWALMMCLWKGNHIANLDFCFDFRLDDNSSFLFLFIHNRFSKNKLFFPLFRMNHIYLHLDLNDNVEPFISLSKLSPLYCAVSSDLSCVDKNDYNIEKAQTTPLQIHNPDGMETRI